MSDTIRRTTHARIVEEVNPTTTIGMPGGQKFSPNVHVTIDLSDVQPVAGVPKDVHLLITVKPPLAQKE